MPIPKHPTIEVPNIGAMDHAWDVLGEWSIDFEFPFREDAVSGVLRVTSWMEAITLEPWGAAAVGLPESVVLERASRSLCMPTPAAALSSGSSSRRRTAGPSRRRCGRGRSIFVQNADDPRRKSLPCGGVPDPRVLRAKVSAGHRRRIEASPTDGPSPSARSAPSTKPSFRPPRPAPGGIIAAEPTDRGWAAA